MCVGWRRLSKSFTADKATPNDGARIKRIQSTLKAVDKQNRVERTLLCCLVRRQLLQQMIPQ